MDETAGRERQEMERQEMDRGRRWTEAGDGERQEMERGKRQEARDGET